MSASSSHDSAPRHLMLYDGTCGLCDRAVQWVLARDHVDRFRFAALQSQVAAEVLARHGIGGMRPDTMFVAVSWGTPQERLLQRARAVLFVAAELGHARWLVAPLRLLPTPLLDLGYRAIAVTRYRLFGRRDVCALPSPADRHRFVDVPAEPSSGAHS